MRQIVIEYVLLENLLINFIVLKTTALITKDRGRLFVLSAFLGACLTVAIPALRLTSVGAFLIQIGLAMVQISLSFKFKTLKKFFQIYLCHFISTFIYGGACYFFEGAFGIKSVLVILAIVVCMFVVMKFLAKKLHRKRSVENFCFEVTLENETCKESFKAFLDSGNLLFDPLTESPVSLINFKVFSSLFKHLTVEDILRKSKNLKSLKFAHYINFSTLNNNDKILVFQVDKMVVNSTVFEKATLGLCLKNFNAAFGADIILHNNMAFAEELQEENKRSKVKMKIFRRRKDELAD